MALTRLTLADGQLAAATGTILAGSSLNEPAKLDVVLFNTASTAETVVVTLARAGGTARQIAGATLAQRESLLISGLAMQQDDTLAGYSTNASAVNYMVSGGSEGPFRVQALNSSGAAKTQASQATRTFQIGTRAKVGGTAGWTVAAANDLPYVATMAASQTGGTLVLPVDGLNIGDTITGFRIVAQVESAGNAVTIDASLRAVTNVAAEPTDASIGAITQVSVTADTAVSQAKTGLSEVVTSGKTYYLLVTATTLGSTDIILLHPEITVTSAV